MSTATVTPVSVEVSREELIARIAELETRIEAKKLNEGSDIKITQPRLADVAKGVKASDGGSLSMYGLGHFPVTLTFTQWVIVAKKLPKLFLFAAANFTKLFFKTTEQHDAAAEYLNLVKK
jgi:hypothetical protein